MIYNRFIAKHLNALDESIKLFRSSQLRNSYKTTTLQNIKLNKISEIKDSNLKFQMSPVTKMKK